MTPSPQPLTDRFEFIDASPHGQNRVLEPEHYDVKDRISGAERSLRLWRKTGTTADRDLHELWRHETRHVQRIMSYSEASEVIVEVLQFVEDADYFGVVLKHAGEPLSRALKRVSPRHWLNQIGSPRPRSLLWQNLKRIVRALGIVHAQGLVHGRLSADTIMTESLDEPDFRLSGFEWCLWIADQDQAARRAQDPRRLSSSHIYSFTEDWRSLGRVAAQLFGFTVNDAGELDMSSEGSVLVNLLERTLLRRLCAPAASDAVDSQSIARTIDDILSNLSASATGRAGTLLLTVAQWDALGPPIYDVTNKEIAIDDVERQLEWMRADLDSGSTLLIPDPFDPAASNLRLVSASMIYFLRAYRTRDTRVAQWDIAICTRAEPRSAELNLARADEHDLLHPITVTPWIGEAEKLRTRLAGTALDWSSLVRPATITKPSREAVVRRALLLVQVVEAALRALDVRPIRVVRSWTDSDGHHAYVRSDVAADRDTLCLRFGLPSAEEALRQWFEDEQYDESAVLRVTRQGQLASSRAGDVVVWFRDALLWKGVRVYQFRCESEIPSGTGYFLRTNTEIGNELVMRRRLRNIAALETRVDLARSLDDPWRERTSTHELLDETDPGLADLDDPKRDALRGLWSTRPTYFVVGPPGVGKTRLATEVLRLRFAAESAARVLITAQGHDALENLQGQVLRAAASSEDAAPIVVRSTTPERRTSSDQEVHRFTATCLQRLLESNLGSALPESMRQRIERAIDAAQKYEIDRDSIARDERVAINAMSQLVLDGANVVITTANSADIERLVEAREQFDWVIVEEAAKATGPELVGPLMLSGRRLLIGDHHQLPPMEAERLAKVLSDHGLIGQLIDQLEALLGPLIGDSDLEELSAVRADPDTLREVAVLAHGLVEPFRWCVEEDARREKGGGTHRAIASTLTEQRRMDPAIARVVSTAFYRQKKLTTAPARAALVRSRDCPIAVQTPLPASPIVVVDHPHVSFTSNHRPMEWGRPRWTNRDEVESVINVLTRIRAKPTAPPPTLAVLSPYAAQTEAIRQRVNSLRDTALAHLSGFRPVRDNVGFVGTVDAFQGSEADVVVVSLVRNNPRVGAGALGFLRDPRRMNVLLSRAKWHLFLVTSMRFLREAVEGAGRASPEASQLDFLTLALDEIELLAGERLADGSSAATVIPAAELARRV